MMVPLNHLEVEKERTQMSFSLHPYSIGWNSRQQTHPTDDLTPETLRKYFQLWSQGLFDEGRDEIKDC